MFLFLKCTRLAALFVSLQSFVFYYDFLVLATRTLGIINSTKGRDTRAMLEGLGIGNM